MLIGLTGVTGVGKSFFKKVIAKELGFKNLPIVTTREKRVGEINGIDKEFVSDAQFEEMKQLGITQVSFEFLGAQYAYRKEYLQSLENRVAEVHYTTIYELKKCAKDLLTIYMIPHDIERARLELKKRNLPKEVYQKRLTEMQEQVEEYSHNQELQNQFDFVFVNDYTESSKQKLLALIKQKINLFKKV